MLIYLHHQTTDLSATAQNSTGFLNLHHRIRYTSLYVVVQHNHIHNPIKHEGHFNLFSERHPSTSGQL